jgi:hypothetical protein
MRVSSKPGPLLLFKCVFDQDLTVNIKLKVKSFNFAIGLTPLLLAAILSLTGCSKTSSWDKTYPVTGRLSYKGKPLSDAELAFFPTDPDAPDTVRPKAKSSEDGSFVVWTYQRGDGAPAGRYKVTVVHHSVAVSKDTLVAKPNDLPGKYARRDTTDLQIEVQKGVNEIPPFQL